MDVRSGYSCWVLCPALGMVLPEQSRSLEREAIRMIKKSFYLWFLSAELWKAWHVWISLCKMKGNTKGNKTQFFWYVTDGYEEEDDRLFFLFATGGTRNLMGCGFFFTWVSDSLCISPEGWSITRTLIAIDLPAFHLPYIVLIMLLHGLTA